MTQLEQKHLEASTHIESTADNINKTSRHNSTKDTVTACCLLLNPLLRDQSSSISKNVQTWLTLYSIEKTLTKLSHLIRKTGWNYTQCVHRFSSQTLQPKYKIDDVPSPDPSLF